MNLATAFVLGCVSVAALTAVYYCTEGLALSDWREMLKRARRLFWTQEGDLP